MVAGFCGPEVLPETPFAKVDVVFLLPLSLAALEDLPFLLFLDLALLVSFELFMFFAFFAQFHDFFVVLLSGCLSLREV